MDRDQFRPVLDRLYSLLGWDPETGWPTRDKLEALGLAELYAPMVDVHPKGIVAGASASYVTEVL